MNGSWFEGDVYVGIDLDFVPFGEVSFGVVIDLDTPLDSGIYGAHGVGGGGNVGAGVTLGYSYGDIEGGSTGIDINGPGGWGVNYGTGEDGEDYAGVTYGVGVGGSASQTNTNTFSIQDAIDKLSGNKDDEDDGKSEPEKVETEELPPA